MNLRLNIKQQTRYIAESDKFTLKNDCKNNLINKNIQSNAV